MIDVVVFAKKHYWTFVACFPNMLGRLLMYFQIITLSFIKGIVKFKRPYDY